MTRMVRQDLVDEFIKLRPANGFQFLMADPPWLYKMGKGPKTRAPDRHYECMGLDEIRELPVSVLAGPDSCLWLWTTHPFLEEAFGIARAWGFIPRTSGEWVKTDKAGKPVMGPGYWFRGTGEPYVFATRGSPRRAARNVPGSFLAPRREHSRKPDLAYEHAERICPHGLRIDLFSRQKRPGWTVWGRQSTKFPPKEATVTTTLKTFGELSRHLAPSSAQAEAQAEARAGRGGRREIPQPQRGILDDIRASRSDLVGVDGGPPRAA